MGYASVCGGMSNSTRTAVAETVIMAAEMATKIATFAPL